MFKAHKLNSAFQIIWLKQDGMNSILYDRGEGIGLYSTVFKTTVILKMKDLQLNENKVVFCPNRAVRFYRWFCNINHKADEHLGTLDIKETTYTCIIIFHVSP